jgi:hypothetical protein
LRLHLSVISFLVDCFSVRLRCSLMYGDSFGF